MPLANGDYSRSLGTPYIVLKPSISSKLVQPNSPKRRTTFLEVILPRWSVPSLRSILRRDIHRSFRLQTRRPFSINLRRIPICYRMCKSECADEISGCVPGKRVSHVLVALVAVTGQSRSGSRLRYHTYPQYPMEP
jgi:hypothetical protein